MAEPAPLPDGEDAAHLRPPAGLVGRGPYRYARWDGRQRTPDLAAEELLDAIGDDLLADGDVSSALGRLFQRGLRRTSKRDGLAGLRDLRARLARAREHALSRYQLAGVLDGLRDELDEIVATERRGLERRLLAAGDGASPEAALAAQLAARRQSQLADLPDEPGSRMKALGDYDFMEPEARRRYGELLDRLRAQVLDSYFAGLSEAIKQATPEDLAENRQMVRELNRLLGERLAGGDSDASEFLARHGQFFPGAKTLDDVIEQLAARMGAMQSLLASMSTEQRSELQQMMDSLLRDDRLRWDLAQLASTLDQLLPDGLGRQYDFAGSEALSLDGALAELERLDRLEAMADQLASAHSPAALDEVDPRALAGLLDEDAADDLRTLQALARRLEDAGLVERRGERLQLTPRGTRRIGQRVLDELFRRLRRDVFGSHLREDAGPGGEQADTSHRYEFGQPFLVDLPGTLANALARESQAAGKGPTGGRPARLQLEPSDFEVFETSAANRAATVLLVDMSRSMLLRGCFLAAKKVAIALDALIRSRYPHDELHVVGFAYYAREIRAGALAGLSWHGYEYGTNLQHGLMLARGLLARSHAANRQVLVITDGEPTAHFEGGEVEFSYPPTRRTINETLHEVARCTRAGITINTFMLERSRALTDFVERMTRLNRGRAFYAAPEQLGEYVLVDYVNRRGRLA
ncbi:VWA domain-containing protein [soil metagenome]